MPSSSLKSFLIKDILSNKSEIISSDKTNEIKDSQYYLNNINYSAYFLKQTLNKSNICKYLLNREFHQRKGRKKRATFTNYQIYALENYFIHQKYLTPSDRDQIANELKLSTAQVITWFQNRRAKLKRQNKQFKK